MLTHKTVFLGVLTSVLMAVFSCGGSGGGGGNVIASDLDRDRTPATTQPDIDELTSGNTEFAADLYQAIRGADGNLFYSPYSISLALSMTYAGARGNTEAQMADVMHFSLPQDRLHPAFNALDLELESRGQNARGTDGQPFRLRIANSIWGQTGYPWLPEFLDTLALNYGAGLNVVDFVGQTEQSRVRINTWVEDKTEDRIKNLIPQGVIDPSTRLVLVNAIYFNAAWLNQFEKSATQEKPFHLTDGGTVNAPMMDQLERFRYGSGDGWQAVQMPYDGNETSMVVVLPDEGGFETFEENFDGAAIEEITGSLGFLPVHIVMPKFETTAEFFLSDTLEEMGMPDAFSGGIADLSGMDGTRNLVITEVIHKAFCLVDEEGTEAAAATAVIVGETSAPVMDDPVEFIVDRPFVFFIRDNETGTILFVGRIENPVG